MEISTNYNSVKINVSDFDIRERYRLQVCGYCNGVFLLLVNRSRPALWNPSIHQYSILPSLPGPPDGGRRGNRTWMGLGYDSSKDNYKVVIIQSFRVEPSTEYRVWIFGLRSNSLRRVYTGFPAGTSEATLSHFGFFADGCLHWLYCNATGDQKVVAFDMVKETLSVLAIPAYFPNRGTISYLNVLDGCLCMGFHSFSIKDEEALLYVRKKDGAEFTWSLLYSVTIDQLPPFLHINDFLNVGVLGHSKEGDKIMLDLGLDYIVLYDLKEKSFQPTDITKPRKYGTRSFVESLISVFF